MVEGLSSGSVAVQTTLATNVRDKKAPKSWAAFVKGQLVLDADLLVRRYNIAKQIKKKNNAIRDREKKSAEAERQAVEEERRVV